MQPLPLGLRRLSLGVALIATTSGVLLLSDLIMVLCTPTLQAALRRFTNTPVVDSVVASGVVAGAGRTATDHRPNVSGINTVSDFDGVAEIVRQCMPSARRGQQRVL